MTPATLGISTETLQKFVEHILRVHPHHPETPHVATAVLATRMLLDELKVRMSQGLQIEEASSRVLHEAPKMSRIISARL